jgi:integrase
LLTLTRILFKVVGERTVQRDTSVGRRLESFCAAQGLELSTRAEVAEAFVVTGLAGRARSTRGTYRSVLRRRAAGPKPVVATAFGGSPAMAPYSSPERAELWSMAGAQRSPWRRGSALVLLALGIGAGLRPGEIATALGADVDDDHGDVGTRIGGPRPRVVPITGTWAEVVASQARQVGDGHLFCPGPAKRSYHNFVNNFARTLVTGPGAAELSSGRCRSSFICDHLAAGTPLRELLYVAGIAEVGSLLRYARHVPGAPKSKAELRARLRAQ